MSFFLGAFFWLGRPAPDDRRQAACGVARIYSGISWLRFHRVNASVAAGERHWVIIGSSNMAGWGADYRWNTRQRIDIWDRQSFASCLEREAQHDGRSLRVSNLAVNGARLRSQIFLYLYALEKRPHAVIFGLSSWSFVRDGDFREPRDMLFMNDGLTQLLEKHRYPDKAECERRFLEHLRRQPSSRWTGRLDCSALDEFAACAAKGLVACYSWAGLPRYLAAPSPESFAQSVRRMEKEPRPISAKAAEESMPVFAEMAELFPKLLPILRETARQAGVKAMILIPPDASAWGDWFYEQRKKEAVDCGLSVVDLRNMPMRAEMETVDGHHFTPEGNRRLAALFWQTVCKEKDIP